jgi:hypothetical protein
MRLSPPVRRQAGGKRRERKRFGAAGYKPVSVPRCQGDSHSSRPAITDRLQRPTRESNGAGRSSPPIWSCSAWGLPCRPDRSRRGALLPHLFTLTRRRRRHRAVSFLWHFPLDSLERIPPAVSRHAALWRPDFPLAHLDGTPAAAHPRLRDDYRRRGGSRRVSNLADVRAGSLEPREADKTKRGQLVWKLV